MKAIVREAYGGPEVIEVKEVGAGAPGAGEVLVAVAAASLNAADVHLLRGTPWPARLAFGLTKPKQPRLGSDMAGRVVAVGPGVSEFRPGDRVFGDLSGAGFGAFSEQVMAPVAALARVPEGVSYQDAGASGMAAVTALQALRGKAPRVQFQPGARVLVTGASGGVGSFAVQLAKAYGAHVTAVTSSANLAVVSSVGAYSVIDREATDFRNGAERYDLIVEAGGYGSVRATLKLLNPGGRYVFVGGGGSQTTAALLLGKSMLAKPDKADLEEVARLLAAGKVKPLTGASFPLEEAAEAVRLFERGGAAGKIVLNVGAQVSGTSAEAEPYVASAVAV